VELEHRQQRLQPAGGDDRVVVEEDQELAKRQLGAAVAAADEAQVLSVALEAHAAYDGSACAAGSGDASSTTITSKSCAGVSASTLARQVKVSCGLP